MMRKAIHYIGRTFLFCYSLSATALGVQQTGGTVDLDSLNSARLNLMEFRRFDRDGDHLISRNEFETLVKTAQQVRFGTQQDHCDSKIISGDPSAASDKFAFMDSNADNNIELSEFRFDLVRDTIEWPGMAYRNVVYKMVANEPLVLDVLMPLNQVYKKAPVLYFVHGGGFRSGAKEYLRLNDLRSEVAFQFASLGFCCVSVSYRLANIDPGEPVVLIQDCVTDAKDGLRFLKKHADRYNLDPDRMIIWGESAGATIAQILTFSDPAAFPGDPELKDSDVKPLAGISWYGPSDFTGLVDQDQENSVKTRTFRLITGQDKYSKDDDRVLKDMSPIYLVNRSSSPLLLMQGDSDHAVDIAHATFLNARARELGGTVELVIVKNAGHNWRQVGEPIDPGKAELKNIMVEFGLRYIKP